jgi:uncharacterized protein (TIGR03435 family)
LRDGREVEALRRVENLAGVRKPIDVLLSPTSLEPGIFGIVRPVLVWPAGISEHLQDAHLEAILAHEMEHVRRQDNLAAAVHMVVEALFWFHPLVWWLGARMVEERELACDEEVLQLVGQPQVYAESILKTCQFCLESPLACVSGITGAELKKRIIRIMTQHPAGKLSFGKKLLLVALGMAAIGGPVVFGLVNAPEIQALATQTTAGPLPSFEVASIKLNRSGELNGGMSTPRGRLTAWNARIRNYVAFAYHVQTFQVTGGPGWVDSDKYNIEAKEDEAVTEKIEKLPYQQRMDQLRLMVQSLLAERFQIKVSHQTREGPAYALVVTKDGPKFQGQKPGEQYPNGIAGPNGVPMGSHAMGLGPGGLRGQGISMAQLVGALSGQVSRRVLDQTGLKGVYNISLHWTPDPGANPMATGRGISGADAAPPPDSPGPSIFAAIQEQLGLKLEPTKAPVEIIVIDHIERPSEN